MAIPPEKFLFDREFERELPEEEKDEVIEEVEEVDPLLYTETDMAAAIENARNEGVATGLEQARQETAHHAAALLNVIGERLVAIQQAGTVTREEARLEAVELAYLVARRLAHSVIEQMPQADIEQMIAACLRELASRVEEPKVRISVAPQLVDHITEQVPQMAAAGGFGGEIVVIAESTMDLTDCRVDWDEGGAERKSEEIERLVDDAVQRFLQSSPAMIDPLRNPAEAIERAADAADLEATDEVEAPAQIEAPGATTESERVAIDPGVPPTEEQAIDTSPEPMAAETQPATPGEVDPTLASVDSDVQSDEITDRAPLLPQDEG